MADIGIDIGGTFTDIVLAEGDRLRHAKIPSTPREPDRALFAALQYAIDIWQLDLSRVGRLAHGTTVGTNAILERRGARVGLLTTRGFRDVLDIGRQNRKGLYDLNLPRHDMAWLCRRDLRAELDERIAADGSIAVPLDDDAVIAAVQALLDGGAETIAVVFLFSFLNDAHEARAAALIAERWPDLPVSLSSRVNPDRREYERTLTTVLNAYLQPPVGGYLARVAGSPLLASCAAPLQLARSNGGLAGVSYVVEKPVELLISGPAAAVAGAAAVVRRQGLDHVITIDIGGTSADLALIQAGQPLRRREGEIEGLRVRIPMADVAAVGAGGGSIAEVKAGALTVGPRSAGSDPGPVAYGRGGSEPTVTDASLVLGYVDAATFAATGLVVDVSAARTAIGRHVAAPLGLSVEAAALGIHAVVNARMAAAIRLMTVQRGLDPRRFALMPLGGGGGLHAAALAEMSGIDTIIVPPRPGVMAAQGLLACPVEQSAIRHVQSRLEALTERDLQTVIADLTETATRLTIREGIDPATVGCAIRAGVCYDGQSHVSDIVLPALDDDQAVRAAISHAFETQYRQAYGHVLQVPLVLAYIEVVASAAMRRELPAPVYAPRPAREREIWLAGGTAAVTAPVIGRGACRPGLRGPVIIEQSDTTILFNANWQVDGADGAGLLARRCRA